MDDEAVSPVIGVILMVAITVVLASVVFIIATNMGKNPNNTPSMSFTQDMVGKSIRVASADPNTRWANIKASVQCLDPAGNAAYTATFTITSLTLTDTDASAPVFTADPVAPLTSQAMVTANDVLAVGCTGAVAGATATLSLTYKPTNTALGSSYTFRY